MNKIIQLLLVCSLSYQASAQQQKKISTYLSTQYTATLYDYTRGNNPWGLGLGVQSFYNSKTRFKPTIELTADLYLEDDKVLRLNHDGSIAEDVPGMINVLGGTNFVATKNVYVSFLAGASFINGRALFAVKPALGVYFSNSQRWTCKLSFINVFNRTANQDFGSLSASIGLRLF